jgi:SAM-dependent methyltransferase
MKAQNFIIIGLRNVGKPKNFKETILGILGFFVYVVENLTNKKLIKNQEIRWRLLVKSEVDYWQGYFSNGLNKEKVENTTDCPWEVNLSSKLNPHYQLQEAIVKLLPKDTQQVRILDVGAGPLTCVGKESKNLTISITAIDPLADQYSRLTKRQGICPPVQTTKGYAEKLTESYGANSFDLVFALNSIDHSYCPEKAIEEMIKVTKKNCYVLLVHYPNEAIHQNYCGMHQWNLSMENSHFIISSKHISVDFTEKYKAICDVTCQLDAGYLITKILKL